MDQAAADSLSPDFSVLYDATLVDKEDELLKEIVDADAIIVRNRTQVRGELLEKAKQLKAVGRLGVGLDNIDMDACKERGIEVFPATGANDAAVAEYVITTTMMLLRRAYLAFDAMANGEWPRTQLMGNEIAGKTLGLVGFGAIARETAAKAKVLGMNTVAYDPFLNEDNPAWKGTTKMDLDDVLKSSDAISLHVPLTDGTKHIINKDSIKLMKPECVLINAARGGVVDDIALIAALKKNQIAGAALDVYEAEPLTAEFGVEMKGLKNLILTPHIGGVTIESNVRVSAVTAENVRRALEE